MLKGELDAIFLKIDPGMVIISSFMYLEPLILKYSYNLAPIIFKPMLPELDVLDQPGTQYNTGSIAVEEAKIRLLEAGSTTTMELVSYLESKGVVIEKMEDIFAPIAEMQHIVPCPKAFEISPSLIDENVIYLGPSVRTANLLSEEELQAFLPKRVGKKIIFASAGSQVNAYPERANRFFNTVIACMKDEAFADVSLILSAGSHAANYTDLPDNMAMFSWVPQVSLLQKVSVALIHGGMGTIKECIYYGVPTLVIPMGRDQPDTARRVVENKIGLSIQLEDLSLAVLKENLLELLHSETIQAETHKMMEIFRQEENAKRELDLVENALNKFEI
ncbi:MAG: glycosyltransferase [Saprospiraceae bacterium]